MTKNELKRINKLLTKAAAANAMSDMATERGHHSEALTWMDDASVAMAALYEEFGITDGAHEYHLKTARAAA